jgi:fluoride exporter
MWNLLLVGTGGSLGAILRYGISTIMKTWLPGYIGAGTLFVNVVGSLAIGYALGASHDSKTIADSTRLFFVVGVLGGLTTFSSLAYETFFIANNPGGGMMASLSHMTANVLLGLAAVWLGAYLARPIPII